MNDNMTWRRSNNVIGSALAILVVFETIVLSSNFMSGLRYSLGGAIAVALVLCVAQLSINRRER